MIKMPAIVHWMSSKNSSEPAIPSHVLMTVPFLDALLTMWPPRRHSWGHVVMCIFVTLKIPAVSALTSMTLWERKSQGGVLALIYNQLHPKWKAELAISRKRHCFSLLALSQAKNKNSDRLLCFRRISLAKACKQNVNPDIKSKAIF